MKEVRDPKKYMLQKLRYAHYTEGQVDLLQQKCKETQIIKA